MGLECGGGRCSGSQGLQERNCRKERNCCGGAFLCLKIPSLGLLLEVSGSADARTLARGRWTMPKRRGEGGRGGRTRVAGN